MLALKKKREAEAKAAAAAAAAAKTSQTSSNQGHNHANPTSSPPPSNHPNHDHNQQNHLQSSEHPTTAPDGKKISLLGVGGKKKKQEGAGGENAKTMGKKRTPGEIRIQKGECLSTCYFLLPYRYLVRPFYVRGTGTPTGTDRPTVRRLTVPFVSGCCFFLERPLLKILRNWMEGEWLRLISQIPMI